MVDSNIGRIPLRSRTGPFERHGGCHGIDASTSLDGSDRARDSLCPRRIRPGLSEKRCDANPEPVDQEGGCHVVCHGSETCITAADDGIIDYGNAG